MDMNFPTHRDTADEYVRTLFDHATELCPCCVVEAQDRETGECKIVHIRRKLPLGEKEMHKMLTEDLPRYDGEFTIRGAYLLFCDQFPLALDPDLYNLIDKGRTREWSVVSSKDGLYLKSLKGDKDRPTGGNV